MRRFGQKLHALRIQRGLTLKELAQALGHTAHGYLSELEAGKKTPTAEFVLKVTQLFSVSTDELLRDELDISSQMNRERQLSVPFAERNPTPGEIEKLRLILSTYQDGSGMLAGKNGSTLPGWRDFERAVAATFEGDAAESKAVFDVAVPAPDRPGVLYGISCKMRRELNRIARDGRVTVEVSNSAGKFWDHLATKGAHQANYRDQAEEVGAALVELVESWHHAVSLERGGPFDLARSCYLVLSWNPEGDYQLHQFGLSLPNPHALTWHFPFRTLRGEKIQGRRLRGDDAIGNVLEWYGESGGQLKYYPLAKEAAWTSSVFQLEPLPNLEYGASAKAQAYFPEQWLAACSQT